MPRDYEGVRRLPKGTGRLRRGQEIIKRIFGASSITLQKKNHLRRDKAVIGKVWTWPGRGLDGVPWELEAIWRHLLKEPILPWGGPSGGGGEPPLDGGAIKKNLLVPLEVFFHHLTYFPIGSDSRPCCNLKLILKTV